MPFRATINEQTALIERPVRPRFNICSERFEASSRFDPGSLFLTPDTLTCGARAMNEACIFFAREDRCIIGERANGTTLLCSRLGSSNDRRRPLRRGCVTSSRLPNVAPISISVSAQDAERQERETGLSKCLSNPDPRRYFFRK